MIVTYKSQIHNLRAPGITAAKPASGQRSDIQFFEEGVGGTVPLSLAPVGGRRCLHGGGVGHPHLTGFSTPYAAEALQGASPLPTAKCP